MAHRIRGSGNVTIIDVAREAGVSYATVSRVINNEAHVKSETREQVLQAMTRLGYTVNRQARSLAGGRSQMIGLLVHDLGTSYIGEIIRGIDAELSTAQYDLMLYTTHRRKTKESTYVASLTRGLADGLLIVLPRNLEAYLPSLRQRRFPSVLIDYQGNASVPSVGARNHEGVYEAITYLIGLGHRRIGFITGAQDVDCTHARLEGYRAALAAHGLATDEALIREGNFSQSMGYAATQALLDLPDPPTAIFASNDVSAFGVMDAARDRGLRIPDDISVIGFDDIPEAAYVHPPLTTVRQPLEAMGRTAAHMLLTYIEDPERPDEHLDLPTELIVRASCRPPRDRRDS